jgi:hypothetical protein
MQRCKKEAALNTTSSESVSEGDGDRTPTPSDDCRGAAGARGEIPPSTKSTSDQGAFLKGTSEEEDGMEIEPPPYQTQNGGKKPHTHTKTIKFVQINLHHCKAAS